MPVCSARSFDVIPNKMTGRMISYVICAGSFRSGRSSCQSCVGSRRSYLRLGMVSSFVYHKELLPLLVYYTPIQELCRKVFWQRILHLFVRDPLARFVHLSRSPISRTRISSFNLV